MRARLASLCLLLAVAQTVIAGRGFVFCIEPGGDVSIEAAGADGCAQCPGEGDDSAASRTAETSSESSCPCVDVAFDPSTVLQRSDELLPDLHGAVLALPGAEVVVVRPPLAAGEGAFARVTQRAAATRLLVGTVVLRV